MIGQAGTDEAAAESEQPRRGGPHADFYGYFARARAAKIEEIGERVARLRELVAEMRADGRDSSNRSRDDAGREMAGLQRARAERAAAFAALGAAGQQRQQELARLKREEQAVESLVADLARVLQDFPRRHAAELRSTARQAAMAGRGQNDRPLSGAARRAAQSSVRWNGVMIETARGAKVRAPYFGRVVYADWLQGLGLLLIIGHSGNYMTLYGHAEVLYKSVGDWVAPGDVIAALSDAGGAASAAVFRDTRRPQARGPEGVAERRILDGDILSAMRMASRVSHLAAKRGRTYAAAV